MRAGPRAHRVGGEVRDAEGDGREPAAPGHHRDEHRDRDRRRERRETKRDERSEALAGRRDRIRDRWVDRGDEAPRSFGRVRIRASGDQLAGVRDGSLPVFEGAGSPGGRRPRPHGGHRDDRGGHQEEGPGGGGTPSVGLGRSVDGALGRRRYGRGERSSRRSRMRPMRCTSAMRGIFVGRYTWVRPADRAR